MHQTGYTRASTLGPIARVVTAAGGSIERVFRRADLPLALLESPDTLLPLRDHFRLLMVISRELHDDVFAELDVQRRRKLAAIVSGAEQVLVTAAVDDDIPVELAGRRVRVVPGGIDEREDR